MKSPYASDKCCSYPLCDARLWFPSNPFDESEFLKNVKWVRIDDYYYCMEHVPYLELINERVSLKDGNE